MKNIYSKSGRYTLSLFTIVLLLATLFSFADLPWPLSLFQLVKQQIVLWGGFFVLLLIVLRRWFLTAVAVSCIAVNYLAIVMVPYVESRDDIEFGTNTKVVWANVVFNTRVFNRALDYARQQDADLFLVGAFPDDKVLSEDIASEFRYRHDLKTHSPDCKNGSRIVAFSRIEMTDLQVLPERDCNSRQFLRFKVSISKDFQPLNVTVTHVISPLSAAAAKEQKDFIKHVAAKIDEPFIIIGDLNTTPWSSIYEQLPGQRIGDLSSPRLLDHLLS